MQQQTREGDISERKKRSYEIRLHQETKGKMSQKTSIEWTDNTWNPNGSSPERSNVGRVSRNRRLAKTNEFDHSFSDPEGSGESEREPEKFTSLQGDF